MLLYVIIWLTAFTHWLTNRGVDCIHISTICFLAINSAFCNNILVHPYQCSSSSSPKRHTSIIFGTCLLRIFDNLSTISFQYPKTLLQYHITWRKSAPPWRHLTQFAVDILPILYNLVGLRYVWCIIFNWIIVIINCWWCHQVWEANSLPIAIHLWDSYFPFISVSMIHHIFYGIAVNVNTP